ncbi:MAG TPA: flavin reductase family protein [Bacteroidota bacterium]
MIDPSLLSTRALYQLLISCVVPRPIALVTSVSASGIVNAAPFSFFNAVSANPPILMISVDRRGGIRKDTSSNILHSKQFVVHMVDETIAERMNITSASLPHDQSEVDAAGFTLIPSVKIQTPRIAESPIHMECILQHHVELGNSPVDILFGEVVAFHIQEDLLQDGKVNPVQLRGVGRMGSQLYCTTAGIFEMTRPK